MSLQSRSGGGGGIHTSGYDGSQLADITWPVMIAVFIIVNVRVTVVVSMWVTVFDLGRGCDDRCKKGDFSVFTIVFGKVTVPIPIPSNKLTIGIIVTKNVEKPHFFSAIIRSPLIIKF